jgi:hypothetical protein
MAMIEAVGTRKLVFLAVALALALPMMGCATGPLGSHGVDTALDFGALGAQGGEGVAGRGGR